MNVVDENCLVRKMIEGNCYHKKNLSVSFNYCMFQNLEDVDLFCKVTWIRCGSTVSS